MPSDNSQGSIFWRTAWKRANTSLSAEPSGIDQCHTEIITVSFILMGNNVIIISHGNNSISAQEEWTHLISSYKDISKTGLGPTLSASFWLCYLRKGALSKDNHIRKYWGLGLQHLNFVGLQGRTLAFSFLIPFHLRSSNYFERHKGNGFQCYKYSLNRELCVSFTKQLSLPFF